MDKSTLALILILLAILISAAVLVSQQDYVTPAIARAQIGLNAPELSGVARGIGNVLETVLVALVALIVLAAGGIYVWDFIQRRRTTGAWVSGPNAQWRRKEQPEIRGINRDDLLTLAMIKMLSGNNQTYLPSAPQDEEEKGNVEF